MVASMLSNITHAVVSQYSLYVHVHVHVVPIFEYFVLYRNLNRCLVYILIELHVELYILYFVYMRVCVSLVAQ